VDFDPKIYTAKEGETVICTLITTKSLWLQYCHVCRLSTVQVDFYWTCIREVLHPSLWQFCGYFDKFFVCFLSPSIRKPEKYLEFLSSIEGYLQMLLETL
jgi:hypothetical protein